MGMDVLALQVLCVTFTFILASSQALQVAVANKSLHREPGFAYAYFIRHTNSKLDVENPSQYHAPTYKPCAVACTNNVSCLSFNFGKKPIFFYQGQAQYFCELLSTDKYNSSSKYLRQSSDFDHYSIRSNCSKSPCLHNFTCIANYKEDTYECLCPRPPYEGKHCKGGLESSVILNNYGNADYTSTLSGYLDPVLQSSSTSRWIRCWHAATDGWDVTTTFHPQCDGKGPTVTIVRVGLYVFGGYTDISWQTGGHYSSSSRSFLYSLYNTNGYSPVKLPIHRNQYAIYRSSGFGPTFGGGYDLHISNNAASNTASYTNLGFSYNTPSLCSSTCRSFLAGSYKFSPSDIEVFYETTN